jgi:4-carboxymuconolactone decarboxylase
VIYHTKCIEGNKLTYQQLEKISSQSFGEIKLLALISSAAALRREKDLNKALSFYKNKNFSGKKAYEALLQTYLFAGFPSALYSLKILSGYFRLDEKIKSKSKDNEFNIVGVRNCKKIYGAKFNKLIKNVTEFSPDLADWLLTEGYGKVLSRKGLSLKHRELLTISILTSLKYDAQLYSHINGAVRLKINMEDIEQTIQNLTVFNKPDIVNFGMKVFSRYISQNDKQKIQLI